MKNQKLHNLNFKELLLYPEEFSPQSRYSTPIECKSFCHRCEDGDKNREKASASESETVLISHGCDTEDFVTCLGTPLKNQKCTEPILFLMEDPGGDYDQGYDKIKIGNIAKKPPTLHYYFSPDIDYWPENCDSLEHFYGPYYAYLMQKHGLGNVYITNCVKCKWQTLPRDAKVEDTCMNTWLSREIELFSPKLVVCFGGKTVELYKRYQFSNSCNIPYAYLYHPSFLQNRWQTRFDTQQEAIDLNDQELDKKLKEMEQ